MELTRIMQIVMFTALIYRVGAFFPSHASLPLPATDYTLTELTETGIVRAVARYFEDSNPDRYSPGNLTGIANLTPSRLFREHYRECGDASKFKDAIKDVVDRNIQISKLKEQKALWHFNGNQINRGNRKMVLIRRNLLKLLGKGDENAPNYDKARTYCGEFLHLMHSFYSNTNWIELNRQLNEDQDAIVTAEDLGIANRQLPFRQSPLSINMCRNCDGPSSIPQLQDCSNNIRQYTNYLTGGYRKGQDVVKPASKAHSEWGKCSHGGMKDGSRTQVARGGINKESSDAKLSPHHFLHRQAALTALKATEDFFYHPETGLYALIGERKFRKLLNLDFGTSLTFVIDTTGSMSEEIEAVKQQTERLVSIHSGTCYAASKYVVVPFNDPEFGPAFVTTDPQACIDYISGLRANGGGDCPELANSGLELGLQHSLEGANLYLFTDADDKDSEKLPDVLALIKKKDIHITFFVTGTCGSRRKRAIDWSGLSSSYEMIASASGGEIYRTDNAGIRDLTRIIEGDIRASQVTITRKSSRGLLAFDVDIPIDSTTREVLVSVIGNLGSSGDAVVIGKPSGEEGTPTLLGADIYTSSVEQMVFGIVAIDPGAKGNWLLKLQNLDATSEYKVSVSANSPIDFSFDILEVDESGEAYPVDGLPVAGARVRILIRVSAPDKLSTISEIRLYESTGQETLRNMSAEPIAGRTGGLYSADINLPDQAFFVSVVGLDTQGLEFLRTQPSEVQVMDFKLEYIPGTDTTEELVPDGEGQFAFRVINNGPNDTMAVSVSVLTGASASFQNNPAITASVDPTSMSLATGETGQGVVTLAAAGTVPTGTSVKVTLTVQSTLTSVFNFLSVDATVFEPEYVVVVSVNETEEEEAPDESDDVSPTCTVLETGRECTADEMGEDCHLHSWWARLRATDDTMVAETDVDPEVGDDQSLVYEIFSLNNITSLYTATCCCPRLIITVIDGARNSASCGRDLYAAVSAQIEEPVCNAARVIQEKDITPPTCATLTTGGGCTIDQMTRECHMHSWWVRFRVTDDKILAASSLAHDVSPGSTLEQEETSANDTTLLYSATCCCPKVNITVRDMEGNTASCGLDHYALFSSQIDEPVCDGVMPTTEPMPVSRGAGNVARVSGAALAATLVEVVLMAQLYSN